MPSIKKRSSNRIRWFSTRSSIKWTTRKLKWFQVLDGVVHINMMPSESKFIFGIIITTLYILLSSKTGRVENMSLQSITRYCMKKDRIRSMAQMAVIVNLRGI